MRLRNKVSRCPDARLRSVGIPTSVGNRASELSSVLRSKRAIAVNIAVMRAFVKLRIILSTNKELAQKLSQLEQKTEKHDKEIQAIFHAIRQLMAPAEEKPEDKFGFYVD